VKQRAIITFSIIAVLMPLRAQAIDPVYDAQNFSQLMKIINNGREQITALTDQLKVVTEARDYASQTKAAIGELTSITVPFLNPQKLGKQFKKDLQCVIPDFSNIRPELNLDDQMFSICDRSEYYDKALFADTSMVKIGKGDKTPWQHIETIRTNAQRARKAVFKDALLQGLSRADQDIENSQTFQSSLTELDATLNGNGLLGKNGALNQRELAYMQAKIKLLEIQIQINAYQQKATELKLLSAIAMEIGAIEKPKGD
jgi:hypothetical protein